MCSAVSCFCLHYSFRWSKLNTNVEDKDLVFYVFSGSKWKQKKIICYKQELEVFWKWIKTVTWTKI